MRTLRHESITIILGMLVWMCVSSCDETRHCTEDWGCKAPRICVDGYCVYPEDYGQDTRSTFDTLPDTVRDTSEDTWTYDTRERDTYDTWTYDTRERDTYDTWERDTWYDTWTYDTWERDTWYDTWTYDTWERDTWTYDTRERDTWTYDTWERDTWTYDTRERDTWIFDTWEEPRPVDTWELDENETVRPAVLFVRALIDGRSLLVLQGYDVYWHHLDFAAPGRFIASDEPTYLNEDPWYPEWPDYPSRENRDCDCDSSTYGGIRYLARQPQTINLFVFNDRGAVTIIEQPSVANDFKFVLEFNDNLETGAEWYEVTLTYLTTQ